MLWICFLASFSNKNQKCISFWTVCGIIFVLSQGQSPVKRGFSVNEELLVENMQEKSLVSHWIVCDHINSNGIKVQTQELF